MAMMMKTENKSINDDEYCRKLPLSVVQRQPRISTDPPPSPPKKMQPFPVNVSRLTPPPPPPQHAASLL